MIVLRDSVDALDPVDSQTRGGIRVGARPVRQASRTGWPGPVKAVPGRVHWLRWVLLEIVCCVLFAVDTILVESFSFDKRDFQLHQRFLRLVGVHGAKALKLITFNSIGKHDEYFALEITFFVLLVGGCLLFMRRGRAVLVLVVAVLGALGLDTLLKSLILRPGPLADLNSDGLRTFPSGHAAVGVTLFMAGAYLLGCALIRGRIVIVALGAFLSLGIVMSAMTFHLPSEVVGGVLLSGAWLAILLPVSRFFTSSLNLESGWTKFR